MRGYVEVIIMKTIQKTFIVMLLFIGIAMPNKSFSMVNGKRSANCEREHPIEKRQKLSEELDHVYRKITQDVKRSSLDSNKLNDLVQFLDSNKKRILKMIEESSSESINICNRNVQIKTKLKSFVTDNYHGAVNSSEIDEIFNYVELALPFTHNANINLSSEVGCLRIAEKLFSVIEYSYHESQRNLVRKNKELCMNALLCILNKVLESKSLLETVVNNNEFRKECALDIIDKLESLIELQQHRKCLIAIKERYLMRFNAALKEGCEKELEILTKHKKGWTSMMAGLVNTGKIGTLYIGPILYLSRGLLIGAEGMGTLTSFYVFILIIIKFFNFTVGKVRPWIMDGPIQLSSGYYNLKRDIQPRIFSIRRCRCTII